MQIMESLNASFWIGLAAAIPLSIIGNVLTPKILSRLAKRSEARSSRRAAQIRTELEEIERLTNEPGRLQTFLLESVLLITLLTSGIGVISGMLFTFSNMLPFTTLFASAGQLVAVIGGVAIMKECLNVLQKSRRAREPEKYKFEAEEEINQLNKEKLPNQIKSQD